jgi:hypothetical protein
MMGFRPKKTLWLTLKNIVKSSLFLAVYVAVFRYLLCFTKNTRGVVDRWNLIISSFVCGFAILFEHKSRQSELAFYMVPRALESLYNMLAKRGYAKHVKNGEVLVFALSMALIMYCY